MMCEGGKVDYAGHANDAATNLREVLALDDAVRVALAFQDAHPGETLVVTTGDHETGGLSMGFAGIGGRFRVELLDSQKTSTEKFSSWFKDFARGKGGNVKFDEMKPMIREKYGLVFPEDPGDRKDPMRITDSEEKSIKAAFDKDIAAVRARTADTTAHDK